MTVRRRSAAVLGILALSTGVLTAGSVPAQAVPTDTCGGSVYVVPDTDVTSRTTGTAIARIQLRRDSSFNYWSCITFFSPVPSGYWGMARIYRLLDGSLVDELHCDDGGRSHVSAGGRFCRTPSFPAPSSRVTFYARGDLYKGSDSVAFAWTLPPRR